MEKSDDVKKVRVHPLAIASICDHYTRVSMGGTILKPSDPVVGLLFGTQSGLTVEIIDATDAIYTVSATGEVQLDQAANFPNPLEPKNKNNKTDLIIAPFAYMQYELLGWYTLSASTEPAPWCMDIHRQIRSFNEAPLFLLMNHSPQPYSKQLPLSIFDTETHTLSSGENSEAFTSLSFGLETSQTERISVDQVTKQGPTDGASTLEVQNTTLQTSLKILHEKVEVIVGALRAQQCAEPDRVDHQLLRRVRKIVKQLPAVDAGTFAQTHGADTLDALMGAYLSAATQTTCALTDAAVLYGLVFGDRGNERSRRFNF